MAQGKRVLNSLGGFSLQEKMPKKLTPSNLVGHWISVQFPAGYGREGQSSQAPNEQQMIGKVTKFSKVSISLLNSFTTSASTFSKTPASYVSSSLTTKVSLLKSAADVVKCTDVDYATGSFCSSCSIPPLTAGGLWSTGKGCAMCDYDYDDNYGG